MKSRNVVKQDANHVNLHLAIIGLLTAAAITALVVALICNYVLDSFGSSNAMALLITDGGIKSDDKNLEHQLSTATLALKACRDLGWALGIGCLGVGVAVIMRMIREKAA